MLIASFPDSILRFRGALIDTLLESGVTVQIVAPDLPHDSQLSRNLVDRGCVVHELSLARAGLNPFRDIKTLVLLYRLMRRHRPDYVLAYTIKPVIYGLIAARMARVRGRFALITGLGYAFTGESSGLRRYVKKVAETLYWFSLRGAKHVFFQNPDDEQLFKDRAILSKAVSSSVVNGSGIDIHQFVPAKLPEHTHFLLIARLLGDKGVREYAAAAALLKSEYPHVEFCLAGWIDENPDAISQEELQAWSAPCGPITFLGKLEDVRDAISNASVYVLPSYREGTPRTVLEAMSMGRAIITTDAPGCRETVTDGVNGMLVKVGSVDSLAGAMRTLLNNRDSVIQMGLESRRMATEKYDVRLVNNDLLAGMGIVTTSARKES
jgi:glycosyltransferase involved in cell wall biosynthesis